MVRAVYFVESCCSNFLGKGELKRSQTCRICSCGGCVLFTQVWFSFSSAQQVSISCTFMYSLP